MRSVATSFAGADGESLACVHLHGSVCSALVGTPLRELGSACKGASWDAIRNGERPQAEAM